MPNFIKQSSPFIVSTTDGKLIEEHFGLASIRSGDYSIAHMIVPPGWLEPHQTPDFDEITMMVLGKKLIEVDGEEIILGEGESLLVKKGARVRYANPFDEPAEYWSLCMPAFTIERAGREEE